jgi:hypothetical protein
MFLGAPETLKSERSPLQIGHVEFDVSHIDNGSREQDCPQHGSWIG